ncbi:MAG: YtxH domain-containing protein [Alistipes sp.]|nr:YtxH domain-containing protein [Alistipes sp.]MBP3456000.1 YtxH domain-containing protein [Alistipes sp.]
MKNTSKCILSALGGALAGAAIAMLFTPQSGKELRQKIRDMADDEMSKLRRNFKSCHCGDEIEDTVDDIVK